MTASPFESALRAEIARIARKEVVAQTTEIRKAVSDLRSDIKGLDRRLQALERLVSAQAPAREPKARAPAIAAPARGPARFRPAWLVSMRKRLGLTQSELARVLGVSTLSVYNWESGRIRPRDSFIQAIAAVRSLTREELAERLTAQRARERDVSRASPANALQE
jgi:DNA-binding transcriptional regulator YiaG